MTLKEVMRKMDETAFADSMEDMLEAEIREYGYGPRPSQSCVRAIANSAASGKYGRERNYGGSRMAKYDEKSGKWTSVGLGESCTEGDLTWLDEIGVAYYIGDVRRANVTAVGEMHKKGTVSSNAAREILERRLGSEMDDATKTMIRDAIRELVE